MKYTHSDEISRYQIEKQIDEILNNMYDPVKLIDTYEPATIIKTLTPKRYEELVNKFCFNNKIIIMINEKGEETYFSNRNS